jgi:hypothetical protein
VSQLDPQLDPTRPHGARVYDALLGGKDNFGPDREAAARLLEVLPRAGDAARSNRGFMVRAVKFLAEQGIGQFLDIGTGLPTSPNMHEVAQGVNPTARVVYVDNDPMVLVHARALLTSSPEGATAYVDADLRDPDRILAGLGILDLEQPVALVMIAVLHSLTDDDDPYGSVRRLVGALPSGSYLTISHATYDPLPEATRRMMDLAAKAGPPGQPRTLYEVERFFEGLDLLDPGIVSVADWRPDESQPRLAPADVACYGAVGRVR